MENVLNASIWLPLLVANLIFLPLAAALFLYLFGKPLARYAVNQWSIIG